MEVLVSPKEYFNLNQPTSKLIDQKMCVYDCSDKEYKDFFFKKISTFIVYRYPTAKLLIDKKYMIELPLNWKIMTSNNHDYICEMTPIEDLIHFDTNHIPMFNPYHPGVIKLSEVDIYSLNPNPVEHFVPKLPKKNILVMPVSNNHCVTTIEDRKGNIIDEYVKCVFCQDDLDTSKISLNLWDMVDG